MKKIIKRKRKPISTDELSMKIINRILLAMIRKKKRVQSKCTHYNNRSDCLNHVGVSVYCKKCDELFTPVEANITDCENVIMLIAEIKNVLQSIKLYYAMSNRKIPTDTQKAISNILVYIDEIPRIFDDACRVYKGSEFPFHNIKPSA